MAFVYAVFSMVGETDNGPTYHLLGVHNELMGAIRYLNSIGKNGIDPNTLLFGNNGNSYIIGYRESFDNMHIDIGHFGGFLIEEIEVKP